MILINKKIIMEIEMNQKQYNEIIKALIFYFRFSIAQPEIAIEEIVPLCDMHEIGIDYDKKHEWANETKKLFFWMTSWESFWYSRSPLAYEILNEMELARGSTDRTTLKCTKHPLIKITKK